MEISYARHPKHQQLTIHTGTREQTARPATSILDPDARHGLPALAANAKFPMPLHRQITIFLTAY